MIRRGPAKAPTGMPPPITLPKVARSGTMPSRSAAPPRASRKPEMTSSKMRSAPCSRVSARSRSRNSRRCGSRPWFAGTGSMMTAAICCPSRAKSASAACFVIERQHAVQAVKASGTPAEDGRPNVASPEPAATKQVVRMSVIAAGELDDEIAPGERSRQADGAHHRLRARRHQSHLLDSGVRGDHALRQLDLRRARRAEGHSVTGGLCDRFDDGGMSVAQYQRAPGADQIEITAAVAVGQMRSAAADEEKRRATDRAERPHGRVHAAGDDAGGALVEPLRAGMGMAHQDSYGSGSSGAGASVASAGRVSTRPRRCSRA